MYIFLILYLNSSEQVWFYNDQNKKYVKAKKKKCKMSSSPKSLYFFLNKCITFEKLVNSMRITRNLFTKILILYIKNIEIE